MTGDYIAAGVVGVLVGCILTDLRWRWVQRRQSADIRRIVEMAREASGRLDGFDPNGEG